jgi:hypothetical protein
MVRRGDVSDSPRFDVTIMPADSDLDQHFPGLAADQALVLLGRALVVGHSAMIKPSKDGELG